MLAIEEFRTVVRADAREVAERSLRYKFGRLSNRRILGVLRPAAEEFNDLPALSDRDLLDLWFAEFSWLRREMQLGAEALKTHFHSEVTLRRYSPLSPQRTPGLH